jgi:hypothetical protein
LLPWRGSSAGRSTTIMLWIAGIQHFSKGMSEFVR